MAWLQQVARARTATSTVHIGRHAVAFRRALLRDGSMAMIAEVSDAVAEEAEMYGALFVLLDADPSRPARRLEPARRTEPLASEYPPPVAAALRNGWTMADLTGSGADGQWGAEGGTGMRSGLTTAEMALSTPPADWEAKSADAYPWEVIGWKPPGQGWKPPAGGKKRGPEAPAEPVIAADVSPEPEPELDTALQPLDDEDLEATGEPAPVVPSVDPEIALKGISENERERAIEVLMKIWRGSGRPPTRSKLNAHLKRDGLAQLRTDDALNALIDLAPPV